MSRTESNTPNRKHTPDTLRVELEQAQRAGSAQECTDLALLIANAQRPKGAPPLPGAVQARNRQGQRRYQRERTWDQNAHNVSRRRPGVGDWVEDLTGARWTVTRIEGDQLVHDVPKEMIRRWPMGVVKIVDGPRPAPAPAPEAATDARAEACEVLYNAVWDAFEAQSWESCERALRAYEASLAALGV